MPYREGSLDEWFERLVARSAKFAPLVHCQPPQGPWIVSLDGFMTNEEMEVVIAKTSAKLGRSTDQGATDMTTGVTEQVVSQRRTSSTAWCLADCEEEPRVRSLLARIEETTRISYQHFEQLQVLRCEAGEEYQRHHDYVPRHGVLEPAGPRLLTVFLYFSDMEQGGETVCTDLVPPVVVSPRRGRALLRPSVLSQDLFQQLNFRKPNVWGCTGSFAEL